MEHHFVAGVLRPFAWLLIGLVLAGILALIRRYFPKWEAILFRKLF